MTRKLTLLLILSCTLFSVITRAAPDPASADNGTAPGNYCADAGVNAVMLEELSLGFAMVAKADKAIAEDKLPVAELAITSASTALALGSSRGAAARTTKLIDALIDTKVSEDYKQMLGWYPLLHDAIFHLPANAFTSAADAAISNSEQILRGQRDGNALDELRTAQHWLTCDRLDAPLQEARQALGRLNVALYNREIPKPSMFEEVYTPLRQAIEFLFKQRQG